MKMLPSSSARTSVLSWRRRLLASVLSPLLAIGSLLAPVHAQTSSVPGLFNFQGKVANANGTLVGAGTPVNKTVIFRIWDHSTNSTTGNLVYSEQQNVTITDGEFSVLIGQGSAVSGTPLGYSETAKGPSTTTIASASVFAGANRYLGITIDDGNSATTDPEVTPRQQLVTTAYAFRAKYAESVGSNGVNVLTVLDSGNVGIGAANPAAKLDVAGNIRAGGVANASFVLANADNNPVGTVGTASSVGSLSSDAAVNDVVVRASAGKLLLQSGVGASALVIDSSNRVGIGTSAPNAALDVNGALMLKGALTGSSGRPTVGASRVAAEIGGYSSTSPFQDDGFLRLSAGGGTTANAKSFIDLTGFSNVTDMDKTLVFGTAGAERMRISNSGALLLKGAFGNQTPRPAVGTARITSEIAGYSLNAISNDDGFLRLSAGGGTNSATKSFIDLTGYSTVPDMHMNLVFGTAGTERMRINGNGNVGIGNSSPSTMLHIGTGANAGPGGLLINTGWANPANTAENRPFEVQIRGTPQVVVNTNGFLGVGLGNPGFPVHVGSSSTATIGPYYFINPTSAGFFNSTATPGIGIWCTTRVVAAEFNAVSDARIKNVKGRSDGRTDLATLMGIEVTDYLYKDVVEKGTAPKKKAIAQQVEKVYPQAVRQTTDSVPDIYAMAGVKDGWLELSTDLKQGERVKLITDVGTAVHEVLEVAPGRFRTTLQPKGEKVFVFGREVKDFRVVDYEAISMLNVSATQEIKREKDAEIAELKKRVAELEAKDRARDAKLAAIEKLLAASSTVMAQPAKPATANGQE